MSGGGDDGRLVLIAGSGRSGTSVMAGVLKRLGLHLPQPEKPADDANPKGFYESQWVIDFHRSILDPIPVRTGDSRPGAHDLARAAGDRPGVTEALVEWLVEQRRLAAGAPLVVKDPRAFWLHDLWRRATHAAGIELAWVSMLRPPWEVTRSRELAFLADKPDEFRRMRETSNVAAWCNVVMATELATRPEPRVFVPYAALVADWRGAAQRVADGLDLRLGSGDAEVDEFVDPGLVRSSASDADLDLPDDLRAFAGCVWDAVVALVDDPSDGVAIEEISTLRRDYSRRHGYAVAIAMDEITAREATARVRARRKARRELRRTTGLRARSGGRVPPPAT